MAKIGVKYQKDVLSEGENKFKTNKIQLDLILSSLDRVVELYLCGLFSGVDRDRVSNDHPLTITLGGVPSGKTRFTFGTRS